MESLKKSIQILSFVFVLTGCQISYVANSGWQQAKLYSHRVKIEEVLENPKVDLETKRKLQLVLEARAFAENTLGLKPTKNYTQFVQLDRPYVSYIVHAAPAFRLESHRWWFPIIGHVPYKGYFSKKEADEETKTFSPKDYDVFVRGVTAYSTLGWFKDPVWSSMMAYSDADLVNTIIHETVHATIFIKSQADFNERMATYLGDFGTEIFYKKKEGNQSNTMKQLDTDRVEQKLFSDFLSKEMTDLRKWYETLPADSATKAQQKEDYLEGIQKRFTLELKPKLKSGAYGSFATEPLNNARLMAYGTYYEDLSDFAKLREKLGGEFPPMLGFLRNLAANKNPEAELKAFVSSQGH